MTEDSDLHVVGVWSGSYHMIMVGNQTYASLYNRYIINKLDPRNKAKAALMLCHMQEFSGGNDL